MDTISNITPTVALSPLEQLRAIRTEFAAIYQRVGELSDEIIEARLADEHRRRALGKVFKGLDEVIETLNDNLMDIPW